MATAATAPAFRQTPPSPGQQPLATPPAVGTPIPEDFLLNNTWVLGKILGTGSYATVRMAQHRTTGQLAVCKTTTVKASDNTKDMEIQRIRLQREVACLLHLDGHPNIVRIYDVVADLPNDTVHIVMEHVEGEELYEFLKKCPDRRAGEAKVREITKQVLNAFVYMHEKKTVLHRDIKVGHRQVKRRKPRSTAADTFLTLLFPLFLFISTHLYVISPLVDLASLVSSTTSWSQKKDSSNSSTSTFPPCSPTTRPEN
jgi:serine/threonine protein kinase